MIKWTKAFLFSSDNLVKKKKEKYWTQALSKEEHRNEIGHQ